MIHRFLADMVLILHLGFILFVVLGGFLVLRRPGFAWMHLPVVAWGAAIEFGGWICPLTPLEKWLRKQGGGDAYTGGFVEHYVTALIYPEGLTRNIQLLIGAGVLAVNAAIYLGLWQRRRTHG